MSQRDLAAASVATAPTICHIETRKMERVYDPTLAKLAKGLGISVGELLWPPLAPSGQIASSE
jgi:hypothetical protein